LDWIPKRNLDIFRREVIDFPVNISYDLYLISIPIYISYTEIDFHKPYNPLFLP